MKKTIKLLLLLFIPLRLFGTAQIPDILIYNGDTLALNYCPLELYPDAGIINPQSLFGSKGCFYTACWRNYVATWEIINNKLYLTNLRNACYPTTMRNVAASFKANIEKENIGSEFADLKKIFTHKYKNGKVMANWVTKKMISPKGQLLYYFHDGFQSIYETELEFNFENGILIETKQFDNSKTKKSKYTEESNLLREFISKNIKLENLPESDTIKRRVILEIVSSDENGKIDSVKVIRGVNKLYDNEAIRVIKAIPKWDIIYRHGEKINIKWTIPINFDLTKKNLESPNR